MSRNRHIPNRVGMTQTSPPVPPSRESEGSESPHTPEPADAFRARCEALDQAVRLSKTQHTTPQANGIVEVAKVFESYLRGETGSAEASVISDADRAESDRHGSE